MSSEFCLSHIDNFHPPIMIVIINIILQSSNIEGAAKNVCVGKVRAQDLLQRAPLT